MFTWRPSKHSANASPATSWLAAQLLLHLDDDRVAEVLEGIGFTLGGGAADEDLPAVAVDRIEPAVRRQVLRDPADHLLLQDVVDDAIDDGGRLRDAPGVG